ncbi:MAG: hypothetical protein MIK82_15005 [Pantoea piersonii]|jgi:hypothetical protein|uniref:hypothetical protein n=1 Tax=Pantoea TaxID=53335 RepID=UPI000EA03168|nr:MULTISPECIES: hypothetical protein [Pantoea]MBZ6388540.1 hypothetical protein [Pantoea piersonii]MBZ6402270.1 hypothetical protein [Pantoea piersonii]MBZ6410521.1 hypothetical protein [Pantoea piersonii]MBZ6427399.1 hypothetical protein [Pantoea piersonii]NYB02310.1 hypothetical protein [Pantoea piersonii]
MDAPEETKAEKDIGAPPNATTLGILQGQQGKHKRSVFGHIATSAYRNNDTKTAALRKCDVTAIRHRGEYTSEQASKTSASMTYGIHEQAGWFSWRIASFVQKMGGWKALR